MRRAIPFTALILLAAFVLSGFSSQEVVVGRRRASAAATTYTLVQKTIWTSCTTPCAITVSSTGSGNLLYVEYGINIGSTYYITGVSSGACNSAWVIPATAKASNGSIGTLNSAYCLNSVSGQTSITVTAGHNGYVRIWEQSASPGPPALDQCGTVTDSSGSATQLGVAFTLATSSETIHQSMQSNYHVNSVNAPYGEFDASGGLYYGSADVYNTNSGTAPTFNLGNSAAIAIGSACAFK